MYIVLLLIGLLASAAGLASIGFGIPINEFSLGTTLILAGTIALSAGLVLLGLALALRQLHRIAEALTARPVPRALRPAEPDTVTGTSRAGAARVPFPTKSNREEAARELRPEPRFVSAGNGTAAEVEEADAPLSPQVPRGSAADLPRGPRVDPPWRPILPTEMSTEWPVKNEKFENLWPIGSRGKATEPQPAKSEERPGAAAPGNEPADSQPMSVEERRAVAILKSGVVDGMAYTLYADGSIEAQLPEGTVRFASIDELRDHLEKHS
jgi:hypothetical protein